MNLTVKRVDIEEFKFRAAMSSILDEVYIWIFCLRYADLTCFRIFVWPIVNCTVYLTGSQWGFYPTALKGCKGIVFTHGVQMGVRRAAGNRLSGLYLRNHKVCEVDTWYRHWLEVVCVQCHGVTLI